MNEIPATPLGTLIDMLYNLRQQQSELNATLNAVKDEIEEIEDRITTTMHAVGIDKASNEFINVAPKVEDYPTFSDPDEFLDWAVQSGNLHLLQKRLSAPSVREYVAMNEGELPPGVTTFEKRTLSVTKRKH